MFTKHNVKAVVRIGFFNMLLVLSSLAPFSFWNEGYCEWLERKMYVSDLKREFYDIILGKVDFLC